jgi:UDP-glucose 4-epimerase
MKKILVTGGAGYIGSHTIIEILENNKGTEVISADNHSNSTAKSYERIKNVTGHNIWNYSIDLCDKHSVKVMFDKNKDIDGIIHFAAFKSVPESVDKPLEYYHNNIESLLNILGAVKEFNIPNFIFSSSCSVYGNIDKLPVNESTPLGAISPYGYTKQVGERIVEDFTRSTPGVKAVLLRYFNPVGAHLSGKIGEVPLQRPSNLVPVITQTAIGKLNETIVYGNDYDTRDGTCIRDYIHVSDIARAHTDALAYIRNDKGAPACSVYNLGSGKGVSVMEMINAFEKVSDMKLNYRIGERRPGDVAAIYSDNTKVQKTLGWVPKYSLEDMMLSAWKWELNMAEGA